MKKNILVIGSSLLDKGGIVTVMKNIEESKLNKEYNFIHIDTYITTSSIKKIFIYGKGILKILKTLYKEKIDLAHIHMSYKGSFYRKSLIILMLKLLNKPIIVHMHGSCFKDFYKDMNKLNKRYCKYTFENIDTLIVLSESWKEFFGDFVDTNKIVVINNSVPINISKKDLIKKKKIEFVFMGRLGERKGIYDLIEVIKDIKDTNKYENKCNFILAGDGDIEKVNNLIKKYELDNYISNLGWIDGKIKENIFLEGDVFLLPSYNEGQPMAILEAMSYFMPCISTYVGGIPEVIKNDYNGYLNDPGDNSGLYRSIINFLENYDDRKRMSINAFKTVYENFNQEKEFNKLNEIYHKFIEKL